MSGTRRDFLCQVAGAGGSRATYLTMQAIICRWAGQPGCDTGYGSTIRSWIQVLWLDGPWVAG
jgi:hypothetical protein